MINFKKVFVLFLAMLPLHNEAVSATTDLSQNAVAQCNDLFQDFNWSKRLLLLRSNYFIKGNCLQSPISILVLGANQFEEPSWTGSFDKYKNVWAEHFYERGIDLTTVNDVSSVSDASCLPILGTHITLNWNYKEQLHNGLISRYQESFDLITNDYGVSYFIHDETLPPLLQTLKVGGKFIYGPLNCHTYIPVSGHKLLTQDEIDIIEKPRDISFYRNGFALQELGKPKYLDITMAKTEAGCDHMYKEEIDSWPMYPGRPSYMSRIAANKKMLKTFMDKSFANMTLKNFTKFIDANCHFDVDVNLTNSKNPDVQYVFDNILPANHPGASWGEGDWIVMTRKNKIKENY